jgi:selenocysteine lyase/cysteine desulfurase
MIEPVKELTAVAKAHGSYVLIDGAHAPGVLNIDVQDIGAGISLFSAPPRSLVSNENAPY